MILRLEGIISKLQHLTDEQRYSILEFYQENDQKRISFVSLSKKEKFPRCFLTLSNETSNIS